MNWNRIHAYRSANPFLMLPIKLLQIAKKRNGRFLSIKKGYCPLCESETVFIRFSDNEWGCNCIKCWATPPVMSYIDVLKKVVDINFSKKCVFEMSSYGPVNRYLKKKAGKFFCSEYFEDVEPGQYRDGVQCQDVQKLTFRSNIFDLVTCTEVFEHVPDDRKGFLEIHRTLKPGAYFVLSVPLSEKLTVERAMYVDGRVIKLVEPEYHLDPLRPEGCLCYRDYGPDIIDRLLECGFKEAEIVKGCDFTGWGYSRYVIVAKKD